MRNASEVGIRQGCSQIENAMLNLCPSCLFARIDDTRGGDYHGNRHRFFRQITIKLIPRKVIRGYDGEIARSR